MQKYTGELARVINDMPEDEVAYLDYIDDLTDQVALAVDERGRSKAEFALMLGCPKSRGTAILAGEVDLRISHFIKILCALGLRAETKLVNKDS